MSRVGKQIITIPTGVDVTVENNILTVKGPKGTLTRTLREEVTLTVKDGKLTAEPRRNDKFAKSLWGTYMSLAKNMVAGVVTPFEKKLIVEGVGFKWNVEGKTLNMSLGFSHPVKLNIPENIEVKVEKLELTITGIDKEAVTLFGMQIKRLKKPEPYKGKGIRYQGEVIRRKEGKKSA